MNEVDCVRCGRTAPPPAHVPYGGRLGEQIAGSICGECWSEWEKAEVMVINELRLNFMDPKSQEVLIRQLRDFLMLPDGP